MFIVPIDVIMGELAIFGKIGSKAQTPPGHALHNQPERHWRLFNIHFAQASLNLVFEQQFKFFEIIVQSCPELLERDLNLPLHLGRAKPVWGNGSHRLPFPPTETAFDQSTTG